MINLFDKEELQKGINYLAVNHPVISKLKNKYGEPNFDRGTTGVFHSLIRSIISQQISTKAASSVHTKFKALFPGNNFNSDDILLTKDSKLFSLILNFSAFKGYVDKNSSISLQVDFNLSSSTDIIKSDSLFIRSIAFLRKSSSK